MARQKKVPQPEASNRRSMRSSPSEVWASWYSSGGASSSSSKAAKLSGTQQVIQSLLKIHSTQTYSDAQQALMKLQVRDLPPGLAVEELDSKRAPRTSCFSLASSPCAWTCHTLCERCQLINQLIQCSTRDASKWMTRVHVGAAILTTDCQGESTGIGVLPRLPQEVLYIIVDFAIAQLRETGESAVCKLMHTSSVLRRHAVKAFAPIQLFAEEDVAGLNASGYSIWFPDLCIDFVRDSLVWWLEDWSLKRLELQQPDLVPPCLFLVRTGDGRKATKVAVDVIIDDRSNNLLNEDDEGIDESWEGGYRCDLKDGFFISLTHQQVSIALRSTLKEARPPRATSCFSRACNGTLDACCGTTIELRFYFLLAPAGTLGQTAAATYDAGEVVRVRRCWRFRTSRPQGS